MWFAKDLVGECCTRQSMSDELVRVCFSWSMYENEFMSWWEVAVPGGVWVMSWWEFVSHGVCMRMSLWEVAVPGGVWVMSRWEFVSHGVWWEVAVPGGVWVMS